jgi:hypothetical protein
MKKAFALVLLASLVLTGAFGDFLWFKIRNPVSDIEKRVQAKLNHEEKAIAELVMAYYAVKYGYSKDGEPLKDAYKKMSEQEYSNAVAQAAKICRNDAAKGFYRMGKAGEKLLKAIIQTIEDAAKATGDYIDKKSEQYDKKK